MSMNLSGKKILFIGIDFYDYDSVIKSKLEQMGAKVSYFSSNKHLRVASFFEHLRLTNIAKSIKKYRLNYLIESSVRNNDIIFVIKGEELNLDSILRLKKYNSSATWILYLWDSLIRMENSYILKSFDYVYSFDRKDCKQNPFISFRPLFYRKMLNVEKGTRTIDVSFVGFLHSDRLDVVRKVKDQLIRLGCSYYMKLYVGPFRYLYLRYVSHVLTKNDQDIVTIKSIPYNNYVNALLQSKAVLDIAHPLQSGLTMRTIEALAIGCCLLTTNEDIREYKMISNSQFFIINRDKPFIDKTRLLSDSILSDYFSIDSFLSDIIGCVCNK